MTRFTNRSRLKKEYRKGARVYWEDPDEGFSSGEYIIIKCPLVVNDDSVIVISNGTSEAEVFKHEIKLL